MGTAAAEKNSKTVAAAGYDLASAGFLPLREEDEPLSDQQFS